MALYVVATPIGNLEDITLRAIRILRQVDLIAAEDTRRAKILLQKYDIRTPVTSYHARSFRKTGGLLTQLVQGKDIALISESGTPGISDPGAFLIREAHTRKIKVVPIPGASAPATLLSVSGFTGKEVRWLGFLPKKKGRQTLLRRLQQEQYPFLFFESPHRIRKTVTELKEYFPQAQIVIGRELTKMFEEIRLGPLTKVDPATLPEKGEYIVLIVSDEEAR